MILEIFAGAKTIWNMIPAHLRDWSKSEVLNFVRKKVPNIFNFCKNKIKAFWGRVPNNRVKAAVDKITSKFLDLNKRIPPDIKQQLFEHITGSQYIPNSDCDTRELTEIVQTDEEKKAAAMQMAYLIAVLGEINKKQEFMLDEYTKSLELTEKLKLEIIEEMQEAEKEFAKFAEELIRLDKEFAQISRETEKAKKEANDIIDLI